MCYTLNGMKKTLCVNLCVLTVKILTRKERKGNHCKSFNHLQFELLIRVDNRLHQRMPNNITAVELQHTDGTN